MLAGGHSQMRAPEAHELEIITNMRGEMENLHGSAFATFEVVGMTSQVVAGTNYQVKIKVGDSAWFHVKIFVPLPHTQQPPQISAHKSNVGEND
mmetsp:Transcript_84705/g.116992  ORF Transcript_84705/g.116992 Transcript_84705/m.116992 type:complete len:94 (+) Transcript_84705:38-319(+)